MDRGKIFVHIRPRRSGKSTEIVERFLNRSTRGFILTYDRRSLHYMYKILMDKVNEEFDKLYMTMHCQKDIQKAIDSQKDFIEIVTEKFKNSSALYDHKPYFTYSNGARAYSTVYIDEYYNMNWGHKYFLINLLGNGTNIHIYTSMHDYQYPDVMIARYINRNYHYNNEGEFIKLAREVSDRYNDGDRILRSQINNGLLRSLLTHPRTVYKDFVNTKSRSAQYIKQNYKFNI